MGFFKALLASQYYCYLRNPWERRCVSSQDRGNACVFLSVYYKKRVLKAWIVLVTKLAAYKAFRLL